VGGLGGPGAFPGIGFLGAGGGPPTQGGAAPKLKKPQARGVYRVFPRGKEVKQKQIPGVPPGRGNRGGCLLRVVAANPQNWGGGPPQFYVLERGAGGGSGVGQGALYFIEGRTGGGFIWWGGGLWAAR